AFLILDKHLVNQSWRVKLSYAAVSSPYVLSLVVYYAVISPYLPLIPEIVVYGTPSVVGLIAVYDIVILNSNELSVRAKARRAWPKKRK
ncbi:hypothetical protein AB7196_19165, partial [Providencia rettgeri]